MEEDFELISKSELKALKEENDKLKKGTNSLDGLNQVNPKLITEISQLLTEEAKKERMFILKNLEEIKELNKQTLTNVLTRTEAMEFKIEDLIENLSKLVETVSEVITHMPKGTNDEKNSKIDDLKSSIDIIEMSMNSMVNRFHDVEDFMEKLKILLGQIKPSDMSMIKTPSMTPNIVPTNPGEAPPPFKK